jgi:hypothetical protein
VARKRMIDPGIWDSTQVMKLSSAGFKIYLFLLSNADDSGRMQLCLPIISSRVFPFGEQTVDEVKKLIELMNESGLINLYSEDGKVFYISHPNWLRYQKIDRPKESHIPEYNSTNDRRLIVDQSTKRRRSIDDQSTINRRSIDDQSTINRETPVAME